MFEDRGESQPGNLVSLARTLVPPLTVVRQHLGQDEGQAAPASLLVSHRSHELKEGSKTGEISRESLLASQQGAHHSWHQAQGAH